MMNKAVVALVVVFLGFWMYQDPHGFAHSVQTAGQGAWNGTEHLFDALIDFIQSF